uniref:DUF547 domain-containing protein n=1 Tax=Meloidogyne javanica TaxID=6303 RepID=A0A915NEH1_MELJA
MSNPNREQKTQQERAQRFRNQVKYRSEAIQKGQYLLDENVIELMEQKRSGSFDNTSPVPMIDEQQMKENNRETMTSRRSMTTLPEMGRSFSTERIYILLITILEGTFIHYNQFLMEFCEFIIRGGEPLVHFGLNNYTRSTPPIRTYSTEGIYDELSDNARQCLKSSEFLQVDLKGEKVLVAKLFKQYSEDFCINVLKPSDERAQQLTKLLNTKNYTIGYLTMDNDLNISYGITQYKNGQEEFDDENDDLIL